MEEKGARPRACRLDIVPEESGEEAGDWLSRRLADVRAERSTKTDHLDVGADL